MAEVMDVARNAAAAGGDILKGLFRTTLDVSAKEGPELVSRADFESEQAVTDVIRAAFPDHAILGEETERGDVSAEHLWIVDPLDGTTNFLHGLPHFAVSVAYYERGRPVCGVVVNPLREDCYVAQAGAGAFHNGRRLKVAATEQIAETLVGVGFYYDRGAMMEATLAAVGEIFRNGVHGIRRFGTASLDLCQIAAGGYGGFFEYQLSPWDYAAGRLIVEEAGGRCTTAEGKEIPLAKCSILASNGVLHDALLQIVLRHHP